MSVAPPYRVVERYNPIHVHVVQYACASPVGLAASAAPREGDRQYISLASRATQAATRSLPDDLRSAACLHANGRNVDCRTPASMSLTGWVRGLFNGDILLNNGCYMITDETSRARSATNCRRRAAACSSYALQGSSPNVWLNRAFNRRQRAKRKACLYKRGASSRPLPPRVTLHLQLSASLGDHLNVRRPNPNPSNTDQPITLPGCQAARLPWRRSGFSERLNP